MADGGGGKVSWVSVERLTAVRHGESTANVLFERGRRDGVPVVLPPGGDADVPLSEAGWGQAARAGRWLAGGEPPDAGAVSPYLRARQTWEEMARYAPLPQPRVDGRLRDRDMGVLSGLNEIALRERAPEEAARLGEWGHRPPGGESLSDVADRVREALGELGAARRVLVVAHDAVIVALRYVLSGERPPAASWPVPNASVSRWVRDGDRLRLVAFGYRP
ncbi:histidine phosphatase family protein [Streptomyces luteireticuli]|uniref:Histidine phosphatase family protein n=1 Tax=Streptomyces luteireticuli TaxID=173858 RepID=A0ABP3J127_9ACTN